MRKIKFRAWNIITKTMIDLKKITPLALNIDTDGLFIPFSDGLPLMQFTGLSDKSGTEIYEGDIVRFSDYWFGDNKIKKSIEKIEWDSKEACYTWELTQTGYKDGPEWCEVIGNIYENPELLKEE